MARCSFLSFSFPLPGFCLGFSHKEAETSFKWLRYDVSRREDLTLQRLRGTGRTCLGSRSGVCFCFLFCRLERELEFFFCNIGVRVSCEFGVLDPRFRVLSVL
ncbi:hypothetical protein V8G54_010582 [Vigna mungo]|uniref:Uncharacterized protein n=1 Tax=Vigna mungo TaxID=3915 RepID=A0AAQ3NXB6_VIGMU